jgi:hypothetical protein
VNISKGHKQRYCDIEIDKNGTLKTTNNKNMKILQARFD